MIAHARGFCDSQRCLDRRARVGVHHGAFLYELRWGVVEAGGLYIPGVSLRTRCPRCGNYHDRIEVPHPAGAMPEVIAK